MERSVICEAGQAVPRRRVAEPLDLGSARIVQPPLEAQDGNDGTGQEKAQHEHHERRPAARRSCERRALERPAESPARCAAAAALTVASIRSRWGATSTRFSRSTPTASKDSAAVIRWPTPIAVASDLAAQLGGERSVARVAVSVDRRKRRSEGESAASTRRRFGGVGSSWSSRTASSNCATA